MGRLFGTDWRMLFPGDGIPGTALLLSPFIALIPSVHHCVMSPFLTVLPRPHTGYG